jgi:heparan-sulfate lyase
MAMKNQPGSVRTCRAFSYLLIVFSVISQFIGGTTPGATGDPASESKKLLSRLDLNRPGLEKVKALSSDSVQAARELLVYFRERQGVKHFIDRNTKVKMLGNSASESDIRTADNALKHIFIGQSAYPPYFCGDDINWGLRPVPDNEWVWQLNRMYFWNSLALAYWHTGDEKYAKEWCYQLVDWTRKNSRDKAHDYAWRSIETGIRGNSWSGLYQRFLDSPNFTPEVLTALLNSLYDHASFLMTRYSKGSNWGLMEAEGMAFISIMFPEFRDSEKWRTEAISRLNREVTNQVYPDGHQRELAMGYHIGCIGWFTRTYDLAKMNGLTDVFPSSYLSIVEKMCEVPMKLGLPDGSSTQFGDSWTGSPGNLWRNLKEWAKLYNRTDFLYVATEGEEGTIPSATAFALDKSGLYSMRSGWNRDAICLVLKCGPDGGGHCQPDNGTFELYAGGRHLMPDAGSYIYSGDPENRAWFRQTKVHQTTFTSLAPFMKTALYVQLFTVIFIRETLLSCSSLLAINIIPPLLAVLLYDLAEFGSDGVSVLVLPSITRSRMITSCISGSPQTMTSLIPAAGSRKRTVVRPSPARVLPDGIFNDALREWIPLPATTHFPVPFRASRASCNDSPGFTSTDPEGGSARGFSDAPAG